MTETTTPPRRPNIVMILTDDHAAHAIGAYGSVVNATPRIDEIAHAGVVFTNCFVTNALCSPSRASILTGTYSHVNGVTTLVTPLDASQPTFVSQLKAAGYRTAIVGKWHMGHGDGHDPQAFDYWDVLVGSEGQGEYWNPLFLSANGERVEEGYATRIITRLATQWVDSLGTDPEDADAPWCVLIYHKAPHRPWEPDDVHQDDYSDPIPLPVTWDDDYATRSASARRAAMRVADHLTLTDLKQTPPEGLSYEEEALWKYQRYMEDYLRCVASVDDGVGEVIDWLRARGDFEDTLLMYTSDQGFFLGDHGWFDKRFMYEESLRMPLVMSYPRAIAAGQAHDGIVTNVDFAQSILAFAGVAPHERMQGRSFAGDISPAHPDSPESPGMYYRYWENDDHNHKAPAHYGYRDARYKLIFFYNDGFGLPGTSGAQYPTDWELYDLETDPTEQRNVYNDPAYAEIRERLKVDMWHAQAAVGDAPHPSQPVPDGL